MTLTEHIPYVLGGRILDRRFPSILKPDPRASARRNRMISPAEWTEFCNEFELAMSWSRNWPPILFSKPVLFSFIAWFSSVVLVVLTREEDRRRHQIMVVDTNTTIAATIVQEDNTTTLLTSDWVSQEILPDICVFLLLVFVVCIAASMVQMTFQLQQSVEKVCQDYTQRYHEFCGITFQIQKGPKPALVASPPWRSSRTVRRTTNDHRSFLTITKDAEEATSLYQNAPTGTSPRPKNLHPTQQPQFSKHPQHPKDEMGEPPFFDVIRVPALLPPRSSQLKAGTNNHPRNGTL